MMRTSFSSSIAATAATAWAAVAAACALSALVGCAEAEHEEAGTGESALLPNEAVVDLDHDGRPFRLIAEYFGGRGFDLSSRIDALDLGWPVTGSVPKVLNRFGTPQLVLNRGYFHTGFDILRENDVASDDVVAPVSGQLMIFDTHGAPRLAPAGYGSLLAIYDEASRLVVTVLHVSPTPALSSISAPVRVTKGAVIGTLADPPLSDATRRSKFRHTHLNVVDGGTMRLLDPVPLARKYEDTTPPTVHDAYLLDEISERTDALRTGRLDVVVDVFDRDDHSNRNLEVSAIAFEIRDDAGNVLRAEPRCDFSDLFDSLELPYSQRTTSLIDFGNARAQIDDAWIRADLGNPNRRFRYALTHLAHHAGRCTTLDDADGYLDVPDSVKRLDVHVTLWDPLGNVRDETTTIARDPNEAHPARRLVVFEVDDANPSPAESVYVLGSARQLGVWNPNRGAKLAPSGDGRWRGTAWLDVGARVELKFTKIAPPIFPIPWAPFGELVKDLRVTWESGENRIFEVPPEPTRALVRGEFRR